VQMPVDSEEVRFCSGLLSLVTKTVCVCVCVAFHHTCNKDVFRGLFKCFFDLWGSNNSDMLPNSSLGLDHPWEIWN